MAERVIKCEGCGQWIPVKSMKDHESECDCKLYTFVTPKRAREIRLEIERKKQ